MTYMFQSRCGRSAIGILSFGQLANDTSHIASNHDIAQGWMALLNGRFLLRRRVRGRFCSIRWSSGLVGEQNRRFCPTDVTAWIERQAGRMILLYVFREINNHFFDGVAKAQVRGIRFALFANAIGPKFRAAQTLLDKGRRQLLR
jgi:hypothetical protein